MGLIRFERTVETAGFFSPLAGMEYAEQTIETRWDPLTGATSTSSSELATKEEMFYGKTDWEHADELARSSRDGCFFCPEKVLEATPKYPDEVVAGGRLRRGRALVFPNLFPLAAIHAVVTYPERHSLRPSEFAPDLLEEGLGAAVQFAACAERAYPATRHLEVCCNHMLPAGASMVHPHFQVFGGEAVPALVRSLWDRSAAFAREHGVSYWRALCDEERENGERFIGEQAGCVWLAPYAPIGNREVMAVVPGAATVSALGAEQVAALAAGLSKVLAWYEEVGLSAFNFTLYGGPIGEGGAGGGARGGGAAVGGGGTGAASDAADPDHPVILRIIARSAFKPDYRADDYFLEKQLGSELIFETPEAIAATLRAGF